MYTEAMLWLGLILASPAFYMCSKMFAIWVMGFFISDNVLELTVEKENGELVTQQINLDSNDELMKILDEISALADKGNGAHP